MAVSLPFLAEKFTRQHLKETSYLTVSRDVLLVVKTLSDALDAIAALNRFDVWSALKTLLLHI